MFAGSSCKPRLSVACAASRCPALSSASASATSVFKSSGAAADARVSHAIAVPGSFTLQRQQTDLQRAAWEFGVVSDERAVRDERGPGGIEMLQVFGDPGELREGGRVYREAFGRLLKDLLGGVELMVVE